MTKKQKSKLLAKAKKYLACPPSGKWKGRPIIVDFAKYNDGFWRGIEAAASFIEEWDAHTNSEYRLSDIVRWKFNIPNFPKRKMRKNKRKYVIVGIWNATSKR